MSLARDEFDLLLREWVRHYPVLDTINTAKLFDTSHLDAFILGFRGGLRRKPYFDTDKAKSIFSVYELSWQAMWRSLNADSLSYRAIRMFHFRYFVRTVLTHGLHIPEMRERRLSADEQPIYLTDQIHGLWQPFCKHVKRDVKISVSGIFCYELVCGGLYDYEARLRNPLS